MSVSRTRQIVQAGKSGQVARVAACALVSLAMTTAPYTAFADSVDGSESESDTLVAGEIATGETAASSTSSLVASVKNVASSAANAVTATPSSTGAPVVSIPSDPTSISSVKLSSSPVGPTIPMAVLPDPTTEEFIASICEPAREIGQERGLYASVMIAQAILESGSGSSGLSKPPNNNLFGIKGSYKGQSAYMLTSEDDGSGGKYDIMSNFRRYPSVRESLQDYADLLTRDMADFYAPAWKANAKTYVQACDYLQGHYATDTSYSSKLQGLILSYDLEAYDHPVTKATSATASPDEAVFTVEDTPTRAELLYTSIAASRYSASEPIDVDVVSRNSLSDVHAESSAEIASVAKAQETDVPDSNPLEQQGVQGGIALAVAGLAAGFAKFKFAAALPGMKGAIVKLFGLGR